MVLDVVHYGMWCTTPVACTHLRTAPCTEPNQGVGALVGCLSLYQARSETGQIHDLGWFLLPDLGVVEMRSKGGVWSVLGPLMVYSWLFWPFWAKWEKSPEIGLFCPSGSFFSGRLTLIFTCFFISFLGFWWSRDL